MAGHEQVVGAFVRIGIAHQPALGADGLELRVAARDQLVRIDLMAGVPDQAVLAEIEGQVQGQAQFDDAEVAGEMGRPNAQHAHQFVAHLLGELRQFRVAQSLQILRRRDLRQQSGHIVLQDSAYSVQCSESSVSVVRYAKAQVLFCC